MNQNAEPNLKKSIFSSARLSTLRFASEVALRLVSTIVLTRLLTPDVYGVFAVVLVYMYLLEMMSDIGLRSLVLTKEAPVEDRFVQTCWSVSILRGGVIWAFSCLVALIIWGLQLADIFSSESAYAAPVLPLAIIGLGAATFVRGFKSINVFMAERDMQFGRMTGMAIAYNIITLIATITLAFMLRSVWALVLGAMVGSIASVIMSFTLFRHLPMAFCLDRKHLFTVWDRGKWIIGHSSLTALSQSADRLLLSVAMSSASFGYYAIAKQIVDLFVRVLTSTHAQMGLQVFAELLKVNPADFRRNYYRYRLPFDAIAGLCAGGLAVTAPMIVTIVFDPRYAGVAPIMALLSLGLITASPVMLRAAFSALRMFKEMTWLSTISTATIWIGLSVSLLLFNSITAGLICIAFHKVPEIVMLWLWGRNRDWINPVKESYVLIFAGIGYILGWGAMQLWAWII